MNLLVSILNLFISSFNVHLKVEVACVLEWETDYTTIHDLIVTKETIFATSFLEGQIFAFDRSGKALKPIGQAGQGPGELLHPTAMTCDGLNLYVGDRGKHKVFKIDLDTGENQATRQHRKPLFKITYVG